MSSKIYRDNNMAERLLTAFIAILITIILTGCGKTAETTADTNSQKLKIVAAIFPAYDWTRNILGENPAGMELSLLLDNGVDLHSFQPSVDDILTISNADLFIYVGGESDQWVSEALEQANNPRIRVLKMTEVIGDAVREEEIVEGMQPEAGSEGEAEEKEYDEHVWLSLRNAAVISSVITMV